MPEPTRIPISVVLPIRDRTVGLFTLRFLEGQLAPQDELLISFNNCSKDVMKAFEEPARRVSPNFRSLEWGSTIPIYPHWKMLIEAATHDAVVFVHDDDLYHGKLVTAVRNVFHDDPDAAFVTSQIIILALAKTIRIYADGSKTIPAKYDWISYYNEKRNQDFIAQFNTSFYGFRRSRLGSLEFLSGNPIAGDFLLYFSGLLGGNLHILPEFLAARLQHGQNAAYRECIKPGHSHDALDELFKRRGISETKEGKHFLEHANENLISYYRRSWTKLLCSGVDPRCLVVIFRRLRKIGRNRDTEYKYHLLCFLLAIRPTRYWVFQNLLYRLALGLYRSVSGSSKFYRQFPTLTYKQLSEKTQQPLALIVEYLDSAHRQLGSKR
jgi:hypothetical protein